MGLAEKRQLKKRQEQKTYLRKTLRKINKMITTLDKTKADIIARALKAKDSKDMHIYKQCVNRLKSQAHFRYKAEDMYHNIKTALDFRDMTDVMNVFSKSLSIISKDIDKGNKTNNFAKMQKQFDTALDGFGNEMIKLDDFIESADDAYEDTASESFLSDADVEAMIAASGIESMLDPEIAERVSKIDELK